MTKQLIEQHVFDSARKTLEERLKRIRGIFESMLPKRREGHECYQDHGGDHGSSIVTDIFGHLFPEAPRKTGISEQQIAKEFGRLILLAYGIDISKTRESYQTRLEEQELARLNSLLTSDEPEERVIITGKDIGISTG